MWVFQGRHDIGLLFVFPPEYAGVYQGAMAVHISVPRHVQAAKARLLQKCGTERAQLLAYLKRKDGNTQVVPRMQASVENDRARIFEDKRQQHTSGDAAKRLLPPLAWLSQVVTAIFLVCRPVLIVLNLHNFCTHTAGHHPLAFFSLHSGGVCQHGIFLVGRPRGWYGYCTTSLHCKPPSSRIEPPPPSCANASA